MSKTPNKSLIGAFVIGAFVLIILAIVLFGSGKLFKRTMTFVLFFEKSISGLSIGSPVVFMGVPVGRVIDIRVDSTNDDISFTIPVYIELYESSHTIFLKEQMHHIKETTYLNTLISKGLRANLAQQSILTGQLMIELSFIPTAQLRDHVTMISYYKGVPVIPTVSSRFENIVSEIISLPINEIAHNILIFTEGLNKLIHTPETPELIPHFDILVQNINKSFISLEKSSKEYGKMIKATNTQVNKTLKKISRVAHKLELATQKIFGENAPTVMLINQTLQEFSQSANAIRNLANMLEQQPESIFRGKNLTQP